jgi:hypothetical protein
MTAGYLGFFGAQGGSPDAQAWPAQNRPNHGLNARKKIRGDAIPRLSISSGKL